MKGYIQVYTGDGKGKTTAALGLALRAAGAGLKIFIAQFLKKGDYSEIKALARFSNLISIRQCGSGRFIKGHPTAEEVMEAREGLAEAERLMATGNLDMLILEEANVAVAYGLLELEALLAVMDSKPENMELVITGRDAAAAVMDKADLVTEMRSVKHYYENGVMARAGIEN